MPASVGLVIVDSFAAGVPMVTTDRPFQRARDPVCVSSRQRLAGAGPLEHYINAVAAILGDKDFRTRLQDSSRAASQTDAPFEGMRHALHRRRRGPRWSCSNRSSKRHTQLNVEFLQTKARVADRDADELGPQHSHHRRGHRMVCGAQDDLIGDVVFMADGERPD